MPGPGCCLQCQQQRACANQDSSQELYSVGRLHSLQAMVSSSLYEKLIIATPILVRSIPEFDWVLISVLCRFESHYGIPLGRKKSKKIEVRTLHLYKHIWKSDWYRKILCAIVYASVGKSLFCRNRLKMMFYLWRSPTTFRRSLLPGNPPPRLTHT